MAIQNIFERMELKYMLTTEQYQKLCDYFSPHMELDKYGRHKISNIYFDTEDYRVIRHSLEKPRYKEKLRLRIYGEPQADSPAFIELKKKYNGVVYKRRISAEQSKAFAYLLEGAEPEQPSQIHKEIDYFKSTFEDLTPRVYLSYEREAYFSHEDDNFRMTFDFKIKMRNNDVSLYDSEQDLPILSDQYVLMEVKTVQGLPFWFLNFLKENEIYRISFSKYGKGYNQYILPQYLADQRRLLNA